MPKKYIYQSGEDVMLIILPALPSSNREAILAKFEHLLPLLSDCLFQVEPLKEKKHNTLIEAWEMYRQNVLSLKATKTRQADDGRWKMDEDEAARKVGDKSGLIAVVGEI
jgi:hypothetical protein